MDSCRGVLTQLNDPDLRGYRALWNYLAGSVAWLSSHHGMTNDESVAKTYFSNAQKSAPAIRWLVRLSRTINTIQGNVDLESSSRTLFLVERLEGVLESLGTLHDRKFAQAEKFVLENLEAGTSVKFEQAHVKLGQMSCVSFLRITQMPPMNQIFTSTKPVRWLHIQIGCETIYL